MNWKLLLIALSLIVGSSARPAEESTSVESSTLPEATTIVLEKSTTTAPVEVTTKKLVKTTEKLTSPTPTTAPATETPVASTVRYLIANMPTKPTNVRQKYANNYANLITKYTINNNRIVSSVDSSNSNDIVTLHGVVVDSSLPVATVASSATTSNSSSKPLVFVDADINPTITTKRAFFSVNDRWSNYNVEPPRVSTTRRRKPVIHKIISKWSDNPNVVYNLHGDGSLITTQASEINQLQDQLVQNSFGPMLISNVNQLPSFIGQQILPHTTTYRPTKRPVTNVKKRPAKNNCRRVKIKLGNGVKNNNGFSSKENCDDINIHINNKVHNANTQTTSSGDYTFPNNDKFEDSATDEYESYEKNGNEEPQVVTALSQIQQNDESLKFGDKDKDKNKIKRKKKPGSSAAQTDDSDGDDAGAGVGSMVMTMMTMMAIFNPLNFGVWGVIMAPMAAMLFGGICYGMYNFMHHPMKGWSPQPQPAAWPKPQEIIIRNKIRHSPIPIKIMHLHKHAQQPPKYIVADPMDSYGPPAMPYSPPKNYGPPPADSYGPPMNTNSHGPPVVMKSPPKTFGEPPAWMDNYHPSAPSGGPYKRKSSSLSKRPMGPSKNSYKFKLL